MTQPAAQAVDDAAAVELWGRVIHGFQVTNRSIHADLREAFDLTEPEVQTLLTLFRCPQHRSRHTSLAQSAGFTTGGFTKIADRLTVRGLTERAACTEDRRASYLGLTGAGITLAAELTAAAAALNRAHVIEVLGVERARALADAMTELYRANTAAPFPPPAAH